MSLSATGTIALVIAGIVFGGLFLWWLLITTEGVYLGRGVVIWLYDVYARRYDRIKQYDAGWEAATLGRPLFRALLDVPAPLILDVATGTGRLPLALFGQPAFNGYVIGLDFSRRMLKIASEKVAPLGFRVTLIYQHAQRLPFDDNTFDAVTCLEALEFMPNPDAVIAELVRVARPGAVLLMTNRKGTPARLMPGKTQSRQQIMDHLQKDFGLEDIATTIWQMDYDQVWAFKPGEQTPAPNHSVEAILRCPQCGTHNLIRTEGDNPALLCINCEARLPIGEDGVIEYADALKPQI